MLFTSAIIPPHRIDINADIRLKILPKKNRTIIFAVFEIEAKKIYMAGCSFGIFISRAADSIDDYAPDRYLVVILYGKPALMEDTL